MTTCAADSGSATGCRPVCADPATVTVTYEGYRGPYVTRLCADHARTVAPRIWPYAVLSAVPLT